MGKIAKNKSTIKTKVEKGDTKKTTLKKVNGKIPKILLTLPKPQNDKSPYLDLQNKIPVEVIFMPFFNIVGTTANEFRKQKIDLLNVTGVILTSKSAVDHFFRLGEEMKLKISQELKYFCQSEAVALYLQKFILYRKRKVFFSPDGKLEGLFTLLEKFKPTEKFLYCNSNSTKDKLADMMKSNDFSFQKACIFNIIPSEAVIQLKKEKWDCIVFFSPNAVKIFVDNLDFFNHRNLKIAGFGDSTLEELTLNNVVTNISAPNKQFASMSSALEHFYLDMLT